MLDAGQTYNDIIDTFLAMVRITELENDELWKKMTQAIRTNIPDKSQDASQDGMTVADSEESGAMAVAMQAREMATQALKDSREPELLDNTVLTTEGDLVPGVLEDEIIEGDGIDITVVNIGPVEDGNKALMISEGNAGGLVGTDELFMGDVTATNGIVIQDTAPTEGEAYIKYQEYEQQEIIGLEGRSELDDAGLPFRYIVMAGLGDGKVKVDDDDTTAGFLNTEIIVDPGGGADFWLKKSVTPGGAADNKLLIEHEDYGVSDDPLDQDFTGNIDTVGGGAALSGSAAAAGYAYIELTDKTVEYDGKGHVDITVAAESSILSWLALPTDAASGDIIKYDGAKYVKVTPVVQTVVTDTQWDSTAHEFQQKTRSITVIAAGTESAWTTVTATTAGCP